MDNANSQLDPRAQTQKTMLGFIHQCICCDAKFKTSRGLKSHLGRNASCRHAAKMAQLEEKKKEKEKEKVEGGKPSGPDLDESLIVRPIPRRKAYTKEEKVAATKAVIAVEGEAGVHRVTAIRHVSKMLGIPVQRIQLFFRELEMKGILHCEHSSLHAFTMYVPPIMFLDKFPNMIGIVQYISERNPSLTYHINRSKWASDEQSYCFI